MLGSQHWSVQANVTEHVDCALFCLVAKCVQVRRLRNNVFRAAMANSYLLSKAGARMVPGEQRRTYEKAWMQTIRGSD